MNFPLKSDIKWVKSLKKGTPVYFAEAEWNPSSGKMDITVKSLIFDHFDESKKVIWDENNPTIFGVLSNESGKIKTDSYNMCYGFAQSPMAALESLKTLYVASLSAVDKAISKEEKRLKKLVDNLAKKSAKKD